MGFTANREPFSTWMNFLLFESRARVKSSDPFIRQYPPNKNQEILYSVCPHFFPTIFGPKPTEKISTSILKIWAAIKWPISWRSTINPTPIMPTRYLRIVVKICSIADYNLKRLIKKVKKYNFLLFFLLYCLFLKHPHNNWLIIKSRFLKFLRLPFVTQDMIFVALKKHLLQLHLLH